MVPIASGKDTPAAPDNSSVSRAMEQPAPSMAADKSAANDAKSPAAQ
jgi:hypothetical protein